VQGPASETLNNSGRWDGSRNSQCGPAGRRLRKRRVFGPDPTVRFDPPHPFSRSASRHLRWPGRVPAAA
jgi:hypothetical protein